MSWVLAPQPDSWDVIPEIMSSVEQNSHASSKSDSTILPLLISTESGLREALLAINPGDKLYIDLEGDNLGRNGTITVITMLNETQKKLWLIDILMLGSKAFAAESENGKTLNAVFEDCSIFKYFWDVRNDADALWALYKVDIVIVIDIQLLENGSRLRSKEYLRGLARCVEYDLELDPTELIRWLGTKDEIKDLMSTDIFSIRPLSEKTIQYCVNDVVYLPALHQQYLKRITAHLLDLAE